MTQNRSRRNQEITYVAEPASSLPFPTSFTLSHLGRLCSCTEIAGVVFLELLWATVTYFKSSSVFLTIQSDNTLSWDVLILEGELLTCCRAPLNRVATFHACA